MTPGDTQSDMLAWPFFDAAHRSFARSLGEWADATMSALPLRRGRRRLPGARAGARRRRLPQGGGAGRARRAVSPARRAHALPRARDPRLARRPCRLRLRHAGARLRRDHALRQRRDQGALPAAGARRPGDRGVRAVRAGGRLRRRGARHHGAPDGPGHVRLDGRKTWISNGGIADFYVVFARTGEGPGAKGLSAFVVDADTPGLTVAERIEVSKPHPLATLDFAGVRVPVANRLGRPGEGFKVAMATLDVFRATRRRRRARLRAPRAVRDGRARRRPQAVRRAARRSAADAGRDRRQRDRGRRQRAAGLPRRLAQGPGRARASPARPRWRRCSPPRRRSA